MSDGRLNKSRHFKFLSVLVPTLGLSLNVYAATMTIKEGERGAGQIFIPCSIDKNERSCFVDTGSDFTGVINDPKFKSYPKRRDGLSQGVAGKVIPNDWIHIDTLEVDGKTFTNRLITRSTVDATPPQPAEARLGLATLSTQPLSISFREKELRLNATRPKDCQPSFFEIKKKRMAIPAFMAKESLTVMFDTGAGRTAVDQSFVDSHLENFEFIGEIRDGDSVDSTGTKFQSKLYRLKHLYLAGWEFNDFEVMTIDMKPVQKILGDQFKVILGYNMMVQMNWFFDFSKKIFCLY